MEVSISLGWWVVPAIVTLVSFAAAFLNLPDWKGGYDFATPLLQVLLLCGAFIVSLIAWLIWALVT